MCCTYRRRTGSLAFAPGILPRIRVQVASTISVSCESRNLPRTSPMIRMVAGLLSACSLVGFARESTESISATISHRTHRSRDGGEPQVCTAPSGNVYKSAKGTHTYLDHNRARTVSSVSGAMHPAVICRKSPKPSNTACARDERIALTPESM